MTVRRNVDGHDKLQKTCRNIQNLICTTKCGFFLFNDFKASTTKSKFLVKPFLDYKNIITQKVKFIILNKEVNS